MLSKFWFYIVHLFLRGFFTLFCGFKVVGWKQLRRKGAYIMAGNHVSYLDPPMFGAISARRVNCMAKKELFDVPVLGPILHSLHSFPVDRESNDTWPIKHAISLLKSGEIVGIFPEGQRVKDGSDVEGAMGVALIAKQTMAPVFPISCIGGKEAVTFKNKIPHFKKVKVVIHEPIFYEKAADPKKEKENMRLFTNKLMGIIQETVKRESEKTDGV